MVRGVRSFWLAGQHARSQEVLEGSRDIYFPMLICRKCCCTDSKPFWLSKKGLRCLMTWKQQRLL